MRKGKKQRYCEYLAVLHVICIFCFIALYPRVSQVDVGVEENDKNVTVTESKASTSRPVDTLITGTNASGKPLVKILIWTNFFQDDPLRALEVGGVKGKYGIEDCPVYCQFSSDRNNFDGADAVVFHGRDIKKKDLPYYHSENQTWIYLNQESPYHSPNLDKLPLVFNWTMTYRSDSDVYHPYGKVVRKRKNPKNTNSKYNRNIYDTDTNHHDLLKHLNTTKLVAWVVSNCKTKSNREGLVDELRTHIDVDVYGYCGDFKCSKSGQNGCFQDIEGSYKFFLSFENSLCSEYVTEKFFNALNHFIVPIVYGDINYSLIAPPHSFIDSRRFKTTKDLADYLLHLDKNPQEYLKYFDWKKDYQVNPGDGWCTLCKKLRDRNPSLKKWYTNLDKWWNFDTSSSSGSGGGSNVIRVVNSNEESELWPETGDGFQPSLHDRSTSQLKVESVGSDDGTDNLATMCLKTPEYSREPLLSKVIRIFRGWFG